MKRSDSNSLGVVAAALLALLAIAVFGLRTSRVVTEPATEYDYNPATDGDRGPVVVHTATTGGMKLFGFTIGHQQHIVSVQFLAPPGCTQRLATDQPWPPPDDRCSAPFAVTGTITGLGTTPDGRSLIRLDIEVPPECAAAVELGTTWPPTGGPCATAPASSHTLSR